MEEFPSRLEREMKRIEKKDQEIVRSNSNQLNLNTEQVNNLKGNLVYQLEQVSDRFTQIKVRVEEHEFKINNVQRGVEQIKNNMTMIGNSGYGGNGATGMDFDSNRLLNNVEMETEVKMLREQLIDEKQKREQFFFEQHQMFSAVQTQYHHQEQELIKRLKEHREDQLAILQSNNEDKTLVERIRQDKTENDFGFLKGMLSTLDKRIDDEVSFRLRSEDDIRKWFEQKFVLTSERLNMEDRQALEREKRIMMQL